MRRQHYPIHPDVKNSNDGMPSGSGNELECMEEVELLYRKNELNLKLVFSCLHSMSVKQKAYVLINAVNAAVRDPVLTRAEEDEWAEVLETARGMILR